jgi:hypothetical protein
MQTDRYPPLPGSEALHVKQNLELFSASRSQFEDSTLRREKNTMLPRHGHVGCRSPIERAASQLILLGQPIGSAVLYEQVAWTPAYLDCMLRSGLLRL